MFTVASALVHARFLCYDPMGPANFYTFFKSLFQCHVPRPSNSGGCACSTWSQGSRYFSVNKHTYCIKCGSHVPIPSELNYFSDATTEGSDPAVTSQQVVPSFRHTQPHPFGCLCLCQLLLMDAIKTARGTSALNCTRMWVFKFCSCQHPTGMAGLKRACFRPWMIFSKVYVNYFCNSNDM